MKANVYHYGPNWYVVTSIAGSHVYGWGVLKKTFPFVKGESEDVVKARKLAEEMSKLPGKE